MKVSDPQAFEAEIAKYPPDIQAMLRDSEERAREQYRRRTEDYSHTVKNEHGAPIHYAKDGAIMFDGAIHSFFSLSYASWLCLPRLSLQEMPPPWQAKFVALLEEGYELGLAGVDDLIVMRQYKGRYISNTHWNNYRRGTVAEAQRIDKEHGYEA